MGRGMREWGGGGRGEAWVWVERGRVLRRGLE